MDDPTTRPGPAPSGRPAWRSRWLAIGGALVLVAFVAAVTLSTRSASVPVGASGSMPGMSMGAGRLALTLRDIDDRPVRVPGGRAGVVVFAEARRCAACVRAVRTARAAVRRAGARAQVIVVMVDAVTSRADVAAFRRAVGPSTERYVVDDRNGTVVSMIGASGLGGAVVYDASGRVVARPGTDARQLFAAVRRARG